MEPFAKSAMLQMQIEAVCSKARRAIKLCGTPASHALLDVLFVRHNGVTIVWRDNYEDGVFKIILRNYWPCPVEVIRERWITTRRPPSISLAPENRLEESLRVVHKRLDELLILEELARL